MGLVQCRDSVFRREPQYKVVFQNAATHLTLHHKRNTAEHLLFRKLGGPIQDRPNAVCEMGIVRHAYSA